MTDRERQWLFYITHNDEKLCDFLEKFSMYYPKYLKTKQSILSENTELAEKIANFDFIENKYLDLINLKLEEIKKHQL